MTAIQPQTFLFVLSHAPGQHPLATESLDALTTALLLNQQVSVLFVGKGLELLKAPESVSRIDQLREMAPLKLYARQEDLDQNPAPTENVLSSMELLNHDEIRDLFTRYDRILSF